MGKTKFVFDKDSGTLKPAEALIDQPRQMVENGVVAANPAMDEEVKINMNSPKPNVDLNEPIIQFRQNSDYTIFQVTDERTGKAMMVIGGYALEMKFNMGELRSAEKIEQLLGGLTKLFRKMILDQALTATPAK